MDVTITTFDGGITPKQLQDIASYGDPKMGDLFLTVYGTMAWLEDGSMVDLEEGVDDMSMEQAVDRVLEIEQQVKTLQEVVNELKWETGYIEGRKGSDFYDVKNERYKR